MALRGTLGDFALTDILQLIGLQRKTGLLVLRRNDEEVTVGFESGRVVAAESSARPLELKVGQLLVRSGKLTESRLSEALKIQQETLQRLGHVLVRRGWVERETLSRHLQLQITETVYDLFRWRDGEYDFQPDRRVEWDRELVIPVPSETLLMEGAQMVDEWPLIERVIPSRAAVFRPTAAAAKVLATTVDVKEARGSVYDEDFDFGFLPENPLEEEATGRPRYSDQEIAVLRWIDGKRTAGEIAELSGLGSFDTFKNLARLLEVKLVELAHEGDDGETIRASILVASPLPARVVLTVAALLTCAGAAVLVRDLSSLRPRSDEWFAAPASFAPAEWMQEMAALDASRASRSAARMERLEHAARAFAMDAGRWPQNASEMVERGFLDPGTLVDPWGEAYKIDISSGEITIAESSGHGGTTPARRRAELSEVEKALVP
ncbi:MAG: DUF4388 domain-containing protein [Acidobacteria bacterium]|nr:DUF4388 domain-containing protein [Acidobacteriota bacterium]